MHVCILCKKEVHTVGAVHLVDVDNNVVCEKNNGLRPTHKTRNN